MALTYRFYRTPQLGDGTTRATAFKSALDSYITQDGTGAGFWDWLHGSQSCRYALARCDSTVHAQIATDAATNNITPLSPELSTLTDVQNWLASPVSWNSTIQAVVESDRCSL